MNRFSDNAFRTLLLLTVVSFTTWTFQGCPPKQVAVKEEPPKPAVKKPPAPEIEVNVASVNLARFTKRIELEEIRRFSDELRKEQIDILMLEGITRYPGVATRIDVVDELARAADMRYAFGETISQSGRQSGNAVFSSLPIRSSENTHFDRITSINFESALQAVVDCGARDVVVVSTLLPEKASTNDLNLCADMLSEFPVTYVDHPVIIAGNLPRSDVVRSMARYEASNNLKEDENQRFWYTREGSLKPGKAYAVRTALGSMIVLQVGILRKAQP